MKTLKNIAARFHADEDGAAMVEYTVLLGIITAATIAAILVIAGWITGQWTGLYTTLTTVPEA